MGCGVDHTEDQGDKAVNQISLIDTTEICLVGGGHCLGCGVHVPCGCGRKHDVGMSRAGMHCSVIQGSMVGGTQWKRCGVEWHCIRGVVGICLWRRGF